VESSFRLVLTFYLHFAALKLPQFDVRRSSGMQRTSSGSIRCCLHVQTRCDLDGANEDNDYFIKRTELGFVFVVPRTESDWQFLASSPSSHQKKWT
jgi:hypothetical protein